MLPLRAFLSFAVLFYQIVNGAFLCDSSQVMKWRPRLARSFSYDPSATQCLESMISEGEFRFAHGLEMMVLDVDFLELILAFGARPPSGYNELAAVLLNFFRFEDFRPLQLLQKVYHVVITSNSHLMRAIWSGCLINVRAVIECGLCDNVPADEHLKMKCWAFPFPDILLYLINKTELNATSQDLRNALGAGQYLTVACILSMDVEINEEVLGQQLQRGTIETLSFLLQKGLNPSMFLGKVCSYILIISCSIQPHDQCRACLNLSVTTSKRYLDMIELLWSSGASASSVSPHLRFLVDYVQARKMYAILATGQGEFFWLLPELRGRIVFMMLNMHC